jgi:hypothetical protein
MTLLWLGFCGFLRPCTSLYRKSALQSRYSYQSFCNIVRERQADHLRGYGAPSIATATRHNGSASVAFSAPASDGGNAITGYTASYVSSTGSSGSSTGASSPIVVSGLTNGSTYTCTVTAINVAGASALLRLMQLCPRRFRARRRLPGLGFPGDAVERAWRAGSASGGLPPPTLGACPPCDETRVGVEWEV